MKVGYYQNAPEFGEVEKNLDALQAALEGVESDLLVLPELFATGYQFTSEDEVLSLAEEFPGGQTCERLHEIARRKDLHIAAGVCERAEGRIYNSAVLIGPDGLRGRYRKVHLFREEKRWFAAGDLGFGVIDIGSAKLGLMICFDWIFPESARSLALGGADVICHLANLVLPYAQRAMVTRAIENGVFVVLANRVGAEQRGGRERLTFTGQSEIIGPRGELLASSPTDAADLKVVEVEPARARDKRMTPENDLFADRRPQLYFRR